MFLAVIVNVLIRGLVVVALLTVQRKYCLSLTQLTSLWRVVLNTVRNDCGDCFASAVFFWIEIGLTSQTRIRSVWFEVFAISYTLSLTASNTIGFHKPESLRTRRTRSHGLYSQTTDCLDLLALSVDIEEVLLAHVAH